MLLDQGNRSLAAALPGGPRIVRDIAALMLRPRSPSRAARERSSQPRKAVSGERAVSRLPARRRASKIFFGQGLEANPAETIFAPPDAKTRSGRPEGTGCLPVHLVLKLLKEDLDMRTTFDFAPYRRSTVGFDRLFELLESSARAQSEGYPPFDIEREGEDRYRITLAVAGFRPDEIEIVAQSNQLTVTGRRADEADDGRYLHRGIATRAFERHFQLADFVLVEDAQFDNGLLRISLKREIPEAMRPRRIEIGSGAAPANDRLEAPGTHEERAA
jgi:molecular chaperone IbpA